MALRSLVKPAPTATASRLSPGLVITGDMVVEGEIEVAGRIVGRIDAETVTIAPRGVIEGDVVARHVRIAGTLDGRVFAHHVTVLETATVNGRLFHHTIEIEKGARIDARMPWRPLNYFDDLDQLPETRS